MSTALQQLQEIATSIRKSDVSLSAEAALVRAMDARPDLVQKYRDNQEYADAPAPRSSWGQSGSVNIHKMEKTGAFVLLETVAKRLQDTDPTLSNAAALVKAADQHPDLVVLDRQQRGVGH
ncbi:MAG: hypothetical protein JOZ81_20920 [Chloroflexi bacterium]|nr:hypothetical protein [Chloroflexota bacterium]